MDVDLDVARASRLSATGESINVHLRGQVYAWPSEMPVSYLLDNPRDDDTFEIHLARVCLGEDGLKQLAESGASSQDLIAMVGAVLEQWGVPQGESPASDGGSPSEAGQPSSETASDEDSPTPATSGDPEPAASAG